MTLTLFLWIAGAAIFFAITNAIMYKRGNETGYTEGLEDGIGASLREINKGEYEVRFNHKDE